MYSTMGTGTGSIFGTQEASNPYGPALHDPNAPVVGVAPANGNEHNAQGESEHDKVARLTKQIEEARRAVGAIDSNALKDMPVPTGTPEDLRIALAKAEAVKGQVEARNNEQNAQKIVGMVAGAGLLGAALGGSEQNKDAAGKGPSGKDTTVLASAANVNEKGKDHKSPEEFKTVEERFAALLDDFKKNNNLKELGVSGAKDVPEHNTANLKYDNNLPNLKIAENKEKQEAMVRM